MTEAEKRMREIYAQELDRDGEGMAAFLWRESEPAHPDSPNGRIIRAMLAAEAAAIERAAEIADEHAQGCAMARSNASAFNDRPAAARADAERLGAELIATAIRSLKQGASHVG